MMPDPRPPVEYATKGDLRELRQELRADFAEFRADFAEFRTDVAKQIAEVERGLHRTILTTLIAMTAIFGGLVAMLKLFG